MSEAIVTGPSCPSCGAAFSPDATPAGLCPACLLAAALSSDPDSSDSGASTISPGTQVGPFRILGLLGRGGMAAVYRAQDTRLDRTIALKVLPPEFLHDGTFARRFEQEARVVARLEHPNIVPIYASGIDDGIPWMSMRLLAGGTLGALLKNRRPEPHEAVRMLRSVGDALDYAHALGIVHRDIKPTNILLDGFGGVYIGDFGLAQMLEGDPGLTRTGTLIGTPHYMAPEQALGEAADHRCDIYSLGIMAYEIFVGAMPFTADSPVSVLLKHVNQPLPIPSGSRVSRPLVDAIQSAVAKSPGKRWHSAGAFVSALESASGLTPAIAKLREGEKKDRHAPRARLVWMGASAAVLSALGLAWWIWSQPTTLPSEHLSFAEVFLAPVPGTRIDTAPTSDASPSQSGSVGVLPPLALALPEEEATSPPPGPEPPEPDPPSPPIAGPSDVKVTAEPPTSQPSPPGSVQPAAAKADAPALTVRTAVIEPPPPPADVIRVPVRKPGGTAVVRTLSPDYPAAAKRAGIEGTVRLRAVIDADGKVRDVTVLQSSRLVFNEAARRVVLRYEYLPGTRNGVAESVPVETTVTFELR